MEKKNKSMGIEKTAKKKIKLINSAELKKVT